jgi:hypothetical protein
MRVLLIAALFGFSTAAQAQPQPQVPCQANDPRVLCDSRAIQTLGWGDSPYVTPDGNTLLMMYTPWNFWPVFSGGQPVKLGPDRPGHKGTADGNPYNDSNLYLSKRQGDGTWSPPLNLWLNDNTGQCCAMINQSTGKVYFSKNIAGRGNEIYSAISGNPASIEPNVNSPSNDSNPWVSADDRMLFFESDRPGGLGGNDIWFSYRDQSGQWVQPVNMGPAVNSDRNETQPWVSPDGKTIYFNREGVAGFAVAKWIAGLLGVG